MNASSRLVTLLSLVVLATPAASQSPSTYREAIYGNPATFDPHLALDTFHLQFFAQIYEPPLEMKMSEAGFCDIAPGLCALPQISEDGKSLTLVMQRSSRFHDDPCFPGGRGRPVTMADVRYSFLRHADPKSTSIFWPGYLMGRIEGLDAWREQCERQGVSDYDASVAGLVVSGNRLVIGLTAPYPQLPALLTQPWAAPLPAEAVNRYGTGFGEKPIGSGPFFLEKFDTGLGVTMKRHSGGDGAVKDGVENLRFEIVGAGLDAAERAALADQRFARGELSVIDVYSFNRSVYFTERGVLRTDWVRKGVTVHRSPALEMSYLVFNFRHNFLKIPAVRQAIALGMDRQKFVNLCEGPGTVLATGPLPSGLPESELTRLKPWEFGKQDLVRAKKLLKDAGFPDGAGIPEIILDLPGNGPMPGERAAADAFVAEMAKLGIKVVVRVTDFDAFMTRARGGELQIAWLRWYADYPDAENFLTLFRSSPEDPLALYNYGDYRSEAYDLLHTEMKSLYPGARRSAIIEKMLAVLAQDLPWIPLYGVQRTRLLDRKLKNYQYNVLNLTLRDVQVSKK
jgi:ABC-type transport system substrate-binding protein